MLSADDVLKRHWGYDAFRGPQRAAIDAVVEQGRDVLVVMATGGGKSICMQVTLNFSKSARRPGVKAAKRP
jgi:ATP-dependent DNA helicase RecQ